MRVKLQLVMCHDDGHEETLTAVSTRTKHNQRIEPLGLTLSEAKHLRSTTQHHLLRQQVDALLDTCSDGPDCGTPLQLKSRSSQSVRPLFGTWKFYSPRRAHGRCKRRKTASCRPLAALLTASVSPALLYMEAKWSALASYGMRLNALKAFLPLDLTLDVNTVRDDTRIVAKRLEAELGDAHLRFRDGDPRAWRLFPQPDGSCNAGMDGGDVRHWCDKQHHCAVIVGKRGLHVSAEEEATSPSTKRLGFVQTRATPSKRRLYEVLHSHGFQRHQAITLLSDGDDKRRTLQGEMSPQATHILDGFPLTMQLTVLGQCGKGLVHCEAVLGEARGNQIACLTWSLWHGQVDKALRKLDDLETSMESFSAT